MTTAVREWDRPPRDVVLSADEVHVWSAGLEASSPLLDRLARSLSADERKRAEAFRFERDRRRFVVARGFLRDVLGAYVGVAPAGLSFVYGAHGKPALDPSWRQSSLRFNLSHSGELALCAVTESRELGVDVEALRDVPDAEQIATRFFSWAENAAFRRQPAAERRQAFFNCWTRKEAYLKALGDGLARPLDGFDVTLALSEPARLVRVQGEPDEAARWELRALTPFPSYVGAVAVEGLGWRLRCWRWEGMSERESGRTCGRSASGSGFRATAALARCRVAKSN